MRVTILLLLTLMAAGCCTKSERAMNEIAAAFTSPFDSMAQSINASRDLGYVAVSFHLKNGRWPTDYAELSDFVRQSNGFLFLEEYDRVDFSGLPDDGLRVDFIVHGRTNVETFTFRRRDVPSK